MGIIAASIAALSLAILAIALVTYRNIKVTARDAEYARRIGYASRKDGTRGAYEPKTGLGRTMSARLTRTGADISLPAALCALALACLVAGFGLYALFGAIGFFAGVVVVVAGTYGLVGYLGGRRAKSFGSQLADVLPMAAQHLRSGMSVETAFASVARYIPEPAKGEFSRMSDEVRFGRLSLDKAFDNMAARTGDEDARFLATAIGVQKVGGGNLADLLDSSAERIEAKKELQGDIDAITSQGRWASKFVSIFPFLILAVVVFGAPDIGADFWASPLWPLVVAAIVVLDVLSLLAIRHIYKMPTN